MKTSRDVPFDLSSPFPVTRWAPIPLRLIVGLRRWFASKNSSAVAHALLKLRRPTRKAQRMGRDT
jgi:hypothetical protein